ncbi:hypothetical protein AX17_000407 [Amanita inopinata Kibby_2008]|nr:hypothetical protein AX17_000407 [Amanita inopinata Kibby_2008]
MPSLQCLEWWHNDEAEPSGGINSLCAVLCGVPRLRYLFIRGLVGQTRISLSRAISLPELTTLRLHVVDGLLLHQVVRNWSLPALSCLILDTPGLVAQGLFFIWKMFGPQLRTVEFGKHLRFLINDVITSCLRGCPQLEEINYYVLFTASPNLPESHGSLHTVGLHAAVNSFLVEPGSVWSLLEQHFEALLGGHLPSLRRIDLYGDWRAVLTHHRFIPILRRSQQLGCSIVSR